VLSSNHEYFKIATHHDKIDPMRIRKVASTLQVSTQTIRNWVNKFGDFLSSEATQQNNKLFSNNDVAMLQKVKQLSSEGYTWDEITNLLPDPTIAGEVIEDPQLDTDPQRSNQDTTNAITVLQDQLEQIKILVDVTIKSKDETIEILKDENKRLRDEIEHLKKPLWKRLL